MSSAPGSKTPGGGSAKKPLGLGTPTDKRVQSSLFKFFGRKTPTPSQASAASQPSSSASASQPSVSASQPSVSASQAASAAAVPSQSTPTPAPAPVPAASPAPSLAPAARKPAATTPSVPAKRAASATPTTPSARKRARVIDSDDDGDDDDYRPPAVSAHDAEDDDAMMVDAAHDDDEDEDMTPKSSRTPSRTPSRTTTPSTSRRGTPTPKATLRTPSLLSGSGSVAATPTTTSAARRDARTAKFAETNKNNYAWLEDIRDADGRRPGEPDYDPSSLYVPKEAWAKFSDFERHYWEVKSQYFDTILAYQKGKFAELYERDADIAQREFDMRVADNGRGAMRMAGFPMTAFEDWAIKFVARGYKVAKVEQAETAAGKALREKGTAKKDKVMRRELTAVLTSGTLVDPAFLASDAATYCMALLESETSENGERAVAAAFLDASTGALHLASFTDDPARSALETLLMQVRPRELVVPRGGLAAASTRLAKAVCPDAEWATLPSFPAADTARAAWSGIWPAGAPAVVTDCDDLAAQALGGLAAYLQRLKRDDILAGATAAAWDPVRDAGYLALDGAALANLGVLDGERALLPALDRCATPMGRRLLRVWVCHPLRDAGKIRERQEAIAAWRANSGDRDSVRNAMRGVPDLDRCIARAVVVARCKVKDFCTTLAGLRAAVAAVREVQALVDSGALASARVAALVGNSAVIDAADTTLARFETAFDAAAAAASGHLEPRPGVVAEYDAACEQVRDVEDRLSTFLTTARQQLRAKAVFKDVGKDKNTIEVPVSTSTVPAAWRRVSATKAVARYMAPEVAKMNEELEEHKEVRAQHLDTAARAVFAQFAEHAATWRALAGVVAEIDVLAGLAVAADDNGFDCTPEIADDTSSGAWIDLVDARHPCFAREPWFIPTTVALGHARTPRSLLLTGSNMGGKSTAQRTVALLAVLAQLGSPVPAARCALAPFDAVHTRIGARDAVVQGMSTLMVEMHEAARILRVATPRSLVLMDELGRGTATFDGHAIAFATLHHLATCVRPCVVFATHYHGLTTEFTAGPVNNVHMAVLEDASSKQVTFLYTLAPGASPRSHGMNVARMAGVPADVVDHAERVADEFERAQHRDEDVGGEEEDGVELVDLANMARVLAMAERGGDAWDLAAMKEMQVAARAALARGEA
ncbi:DNA mismatch repair protein msh6 [Blastocladiella emersonii ATCC 22665]|nr:DNA mismatch repair protein msh6 [Blastocladiella emersonii ATCC 22665]